MNVLIIDNYDSFTYNLVAMIRDLGHVPHVFQNDLIDVGQTGTYEKILLSPGPGIPDEAGVLKSVIAAWGATKSILGVCLGHQGIAEVCGARLYNMPLVLHGTTSRLKVCEPTSKLFRGLPSEFMVTHYHSWAVVPDQVPKDLIVTAVNSEAIVMAIAHRTWDVHGVQFHPESFTTEHGLGIMKNWLSDEL